MSTSTKLFLNKQPEHNLTALAESEDPCSCTTESAYRKVPKWSPAPSKLREIALIGTGFTLLAGPFVFLGKKVHECASLYLDLKFTEASECKAKITESLLDPVNNMTYLCFISGTLLLGMGTYVALSWAFQDKNQGARFEELDSAYGDAAKSLASQYYGAKTTGEREKAVKTAQNLVDRKDFLRASLREVAKLTEPQADLLTAKLTSTANAVLRQSKG